MSEDISTPDEFEAMIAKARAELKARREQEDSRLADLIERFYSRGKYAPLNLPRVDAVDFKQAQAGDK